MTADEKRVLKDARLGNGLGDGNGLSWTCNYCRLVGSQPLEISDRDRKILRQLALRVADLASLDEQDERRKLWLGHNALKETRPLIFCDPETAWYEIIPSTTLECEGSLARIWEFRLRKEIYWAEKIKDDRVVLPIFTVHTIFSESGMGLEIKTTGGEHDGSIHWDPPLKDYKDLDKLHFRTITVDRRRTDDLFSLASEVFGQILDVRLEGSWWWSLGMTSEVILLRGFEQMLFDFYDAPDQLHRLMSFLRDENLARLQFLEENSLLSLNNGGDFIGTGGYGWSDELPSPGFDRQKVRTMDLWGFCESQETLGVSPEFFEEFIFPYQNDILSHFGLNIYGCCEPLDNRWPIIKKTPRLRKVTVSPWSSMDIMAENLGKNYVCCKKVNPAFVSMTSLCEDEVRKELRETYRASFKNNCRLQVLLRDLMTVSWNPENVIAWTRIAREESVG